jgi:ABC-type nitrate/sulfonate/bicarbonate transport system substrate-binding protein
MSDDDDTVPATASDVAAALKDGDIDALVELAKTLQEKTGDREFVESMLVLVYELLPTSARDQILKDGAEASQNIVDLFTRKPRE